MSGIGLLNYGAGNFGSVWNALRHLQLEPLEIKDAGRLGDVERIILPGVGSFPAAMKRLHELDLVDALRRNVLELGKPFLGICVGMQILADLGHEFTATPGLGFVSGVVQPIEDGGGKLSVPHMGWNELHVRHSCPLFAHMEPNPSFYFVHSYHYQAADDESTIATCHYGGPVTACVGRENVFGVQFHPEKSQRDGLQLLKNFAHLPAA